MKQRSIPTISYHLFNQEHTVLQEVQEILQRQMVLKVYDQVVLQDQDQARSNGLPSRSDGRWRGGNAIYQDLYNNNHCG